MVDTEKTSLLSGTEYKYKCLFLYKVKSDLVKEYLHHLQKLASKGILDSPPNGEGWFLKASIALSSDSVLRQLIYVQQFKTAPAVISRQNLLEQRSGKVLAHPGEISTQKAYLNAWDKIHSSIVFTVNQAGITICEALIGIKGYSVEFRKEVTKLLQLYDTIVLKAELVDDNTKLGNFGKFETIQSLYRYTRDLIAGILLWNDNSKRYIHLVNISKNIDNIEYLVKGKSNLANNNTNKPLLENFYTVKTEIIDQKFRIQHVDELIVTLVRQFIFNTAKQLYYLEAQQANTTVSELNNSSLQPRFKEIYGIDINNIEDYDICCNYCA